MALKAIEKTDTWIEKVTKLIPAEACGLFVAIQSYIGAAADDDALRYKYTLWAAIGIAILVPLFLIKVYQISVQQWQQHLVSVLAFLIWAFNINPDAFPPFSPFPSQDRIIGPILLLLLTTLAPLFVPARDLTAPPSKAPPPDVGRHNAEEQHP